MSSSFEAGVAEAGNGAGVEVGEESWIGIATSCTGGGDTGAGSAGKSGAAGAGDGAGTGAGSGIAGAAAGVGANGAGPSTGISFSPPPAGAGCESGIGQSGSGFGTGPGPELASGIGAGGGGGGAMFIYGFAGVVFGGSMGIGLVLSFPLVGFITVGSGCVVGCAGSSGLAAVTSLNELFVIGSSFITSSGMPLCGLAGSCPGAFVFGFTAPPLFLV